MLASTTEIWKNYVGGSTKHRIKKSGPTYQFSNLSFFLRHYPFLTSMHFLNVLSEKSDQVGCKMCNRFFDLHVCEMIDPEMLL